MARTKKPKSRTLTIFLLKSTDDDSAMLRGFDQLVAYPVNTAELSGTLYVQRSTSNPPEWVSFLGEVCGKPIDEVTNSSAAAVFISTRGLRKVAITFGFGRHLLTPGCWEENFGLIVSLNAIDPNRIRSLDRKTFDAITQHTRTQASAEGDLSDFGLNIEQDLLRAVTGAPRDNDLGSRMTGMEALTVTTRCEFSKVGTLLDKYIKLYSDTTYKQIFPWVDRIADVKNPTVENALEQSLLDALTARSFTNLWLAVPDIIDWDRAGGFCYRYPGAESNASHDQSSLSAPPVFDDLKINDFLDSLQAKKQLSVEYLRRRRAYRIDTDSGKPRESWPIYKCIYAELELNGRTYLLTGGKWYSIEANFVNEINTAVARIPIASLNLPSYTHNKEEEYCKYVSSDSSLELALGDRDLVSHGGGHSKIEFCDLYSKSKQMIHVKRYTGNAGALSHLFSQGVNSSNLFMRDDLFRNKVNQKLPSSHQLSNAQARPNTQEYEVVFAIITRNAKPLCESLPFFSRLNLRNAFNYISGFGYRVSIRKIDWI